MKLNLTRRQRVRYGIAAFLLLLIITNPSISQFKAYVGSNTYQGLYRPVNLFICSLYKAQGHQYVGVLGNFIEKPKPEVVYVQVGAPVSTKDSSMAVDTVKEDWSKYEVKNKPSH